MGGGSSSMNATADLRKFVTIVRDEHRAGAHFVPLTGAGFSAASGVLMGQQFDDYLLYAAYRYCRDWDIRARGWPPPPSVERTKDARAWRADLLKRTADGIDSATGGVPADEYVKFLLACGDWRTRLQALARARIVHEAGARQTIDLEDADASVIASFIDFLTRGKVANRGHRLLAQLAVPLRIQLALTTNFDTLHEQAFQAAHLPFDVIEVPSTGLLPSAIAVCRGETLVKLHGARVQPRADHSLDADPSVANRATFATYFGASDGESLSAVKHLLVMGFSGADRHLMRLIAEALVTRPQMKLFWVAHTSAEHASIRKEISTRVLENLRARGDAKAAIANDILGHRVFSCTCRAEDVLNSVCLETTFSLPGRSHDASPNDCCWEGEVQTAQGCVRTLRYAISSHRAESFHVSLLAELARRWGRPDLCELVPRTLDLKALKAFVEYAGEQAQRLRLEIGPCSKEQGADVARFVTSVHGSGLIVKPLENTSISVASVKLRLMQFLDADPVQRSERRDFLSALALCSGPVSLALLYTEIARRDRRRYDIDGQDNLESRAREIRNWLDELVSLAPDAGMIEESSCGAIWISEVVRDAMGRILESEGAAEAPVLHLKLAKSYERLFRCTHATEHLAAALHHLVMAIRAWHLAELDYARSASEWVRAECRRAFLREALIRAKRLQLVLAVSCQGSRDYKNLLLSAMPPKPLDWHDPGHDTLTRMFDTLWPDGGVEELHRRSMVGETLLPPPPPDLGSFTKFWSCFLAFDRDHQARKEQLKDHLVRSDFAVDVTLEMLFEDGNNCQRLRLELHRWLERCQAGGTSADRSILRLIAVLMELLRSHQLEADRLSSRAAGCSTQFLAVAGYNWLWADGGGDSRTTLGHMSTVAKIARTVEELCGNLTFRSAFASLEFELKALRRRALALARLRRFSEARNLVGRALALLSNSHLAASEVLWGKLDRDLGSISLLHAAATLLELQSPTQRHSDADHDAIYRKVLGNLDDAWASFARAELNLAHTSALARLRVLQLRCVAIVQEIDAVRRSRPAAAPLKALLDWNLGCRCHLASELLRRGAQHSNVSDDDRKELVRLATIVHERRAGKDTLESEELWREIAKVPWVSSERPVSREHQSGTYSASSSSARSGTLTSA
jgi:hypothetical protein